MIPDPHDAPQNDPYAYWCPRCWRFVLDCTHLAWPLETKHVPLKDWQYRFVAYDRKRRILELGLNTDAAYQHRGVPLELALGIVKAESPVEFCRQWIDWKFPFDRVRILRQFLLMLARELEALLPA